MGGAKKPKVQKLKVERGVNYAKAPFPYFGGKSGAADLVWRAFGDVHHYVEPFLGSAAVLIARPHDMNRTYYSETVNDLNLYLCNFWRALQADPEGCAVVASWPVSETDLFSRHMALVRWGTDPEIKNRFQADPFYFDVQMAGWWAWGLSCWIGSGWCTGDGPWHVNADGRVVKQAARRGREAGVASQPPHIGSDGRGVNRPQLREPGVASQLPHIGNDGRGVNHAGLREAADEMTMPKLRGWFRFLANRLRHVRILCGEWERALTESAVLSLSCRNEGGVAGIFLDPPYGVEASRTGGLYTYDDLSLAARVREWCRLNGDHPKLRIVLAGFDNEHTELEAVGWKCVPWFKGGFLKGGMGNTGGTGNHQMHRDRLWLSPRCLPLEGEIAGETSTPPTESGIVPAPHNFDDEEWEPEDDDGEDD